MVTLHMLGLTSSAPTARPPGGAPVGGAGVTPPTDGTLPAAPPLATWDTSPQGGERSLSATLPPSLPPSPLHYALPQSPRDGRRPTASPVCWLCWRTRADRRCSMRACFLFFFCRSCVAVAAAAAGGAPPPDGAASGPFGRPLPPPAGGTGGGSRRCCSVGGQLRRWGRWVRRRWQWCWRWRRPRWQATPATLHDCVLCLLTTICCTVETVATGTTPLLSLLDGERAGRWPV